MCLSADNGADHLAFCSKGRKHGGKLVETPTDFSDVLDLQTHNKCTADVTQQHVPLLGKTVYSLSRHPGDSHCLSFVDT